MNNTPEELKRIAEAVYPKDDWMIGQGKVFCTRWVNSEHPYEYHFDINAEQAMEILKWLLTNKWDIEYDEVMEQFFCLGGTRKRIAKHKSLEQALINAMLCQIDKGE